VQKKLVLIGRKINLKAFKWKYQLFNDAKVVFGMNGRELSWNYTKEYQALYVLQHCTY
jgi:hypothetical protein